MSSAAPCPEALTRLRDAVGAVRHGEGEVLPFGIEAMDARLTGGGLALGGLHELTSATPTLTPSSDRSNRTGVRRRRRL